MPGLSFAIDALYAAGWWPVQGHGCVQAPDGRWFPEQDEVMRCFAEAGITPTLRQHGTGRVHELTWDSPRTGRQRVLAGSPEEATIYGFACLCRHLPADSFMPA